MVSSCSYRDLWTTLFSTINKNYSIQHVFCSQETLTNWAMLLDVGGLTCSTVHSQRIDGPWCSSGHLPPGTWPLPCRKRWYARQSMTQNKTMHCFAWTQTNAHKSHCSKTHARKCPCRMTHKRTHNTRVIAARWRPTCDKRTLWSHWLSIREGCGQCVYSTSLLRRVPRL